MSEYEVKPVDPEIEKLLKEEEAIEQLTRLGVENERLTRLVERYEFNQGELRSQVNGLKACIDAIGDALIEEATRRDWCAEYDQFVEGLNETLTYKLKTRRMEKSGTVRVDVTIRGMPDDMPSIDGIIEDALQQYFEGEPSDEYTVESWCVRRN